MRALRFRHIEQTEYQAVLRLEDVDGNILGERPLADGEIDRLQDRAGYSYLQPFADDLPQLGQDLFSFLDGPTEAWLRAAREASRQPLLLRIDTSNGLGSLPWEVLSDQGTYACSQARGGVLPLREVHGEAQSRELQNRPLRLLFMACDPIDGGNPLRYEEEESRIFEAARRSKLELEVEESGSLEGLEERLGDYGRDYFDAFHLSGHAKLEPDGPVFIMETDEGRRREVTPQQLEQVFGHPWPRLIFLSGCETGKQEEATALASYCESVVQAGAPAVLGWALPVQDGAATLVAQEVYRLLAEGQGLADAVLRARLTLYQHEQETNSLGRRANWHLLRLYGDASPLGPMVTPLRHPGRAKIRQLPATQVFLDSQARSEVCPRQRFVGRRRQLQTALRTLRRVPGEEGYSAGVLIHGLGGLGKSSLAARICDRLRDRQRLVIVGRLDEAVMRHRLMGILRDAEAREGMQQPGLSLRAQLEIVLEGELHEQPALFVLDDFEQNVERVGSSVQDKRGPRQDAEGRAVLQAEPLRVLRALMEAIHRTGSDSRLLLTCRYQLALPGPARLMELELGHFVGAELQKKLAQLQGFQDQVAHEEGTQLAERAQELAGGNPRLLERLSKVLADPNLEAAAIVEALEGVAQAFREETLLQLLLDQQAPEARRILAALAPLQLPVNLAAAEAIGGDDYRPEHLQRAAALGLVERAEDVRPNADSDDGNSSRETTRRETTVFVSSVLAPLLADELSPEEHQVATTRACRHLYEAWWLQRGQQSHDRALEIIRLALEAKESETAAIVCSDLANRLFDSARFAEALAVSEMVAASIQDYRVLAARARSEEVLGQTTAAINHYQLAIDLAPASSEQDAASQAIVASTLHNKAGLLARNGDVAKAMELWKRSLEIDELIGNAQGKAATIHAMAGVAAQEGENSRAMELWRQALSIQEAIGDARGRSITLHEIARLAVQNGDIKQALSHWEQALEIQEANGDTQSKAATTSMMATVIAQQGEVSRAMQLWRQALETSETIGHAQGKASTLLNMATVLAQIGNVQQAIDFWKQALTIQEAIGDQRGQAATLHGMATLYNQQGDPTRAMALWQQAHELLEIIGDAQGKTATLHNMATIVAQQGNIPRALQLWHQALEVQQHIGDVNGRATTLHNIAWSLGRQGELTRAAEYLHKALEIQEASDNVRGKAGTLRELACIYAQQGDLPKAMDSWQQALSMAEAINDAQGKASALANMAWAADHTGDGAKGLSLNLEAGRILGQAQAFSDLATVLGNIGSVEEPGRERYLAQAMWLHARIQAPLNSTLNVAAALLQRLGPEAELSPSVGALAMMQVVTRSEGHSEAEQLQHEALSLISACAAAREIADDGLHDWMQGKGLLEPQLFMPKLLTGLEELIGDTWLFDPSVLDDEDRVPG